MNETKLIFWDIKEIQNYINKNYISDIEIRKRKE